MNLPLSRSPITEVGKNAAVNYVRSWGRNLGAMALAAGVKYTRMKTALEDDPDFADRVREAEGAYLSKLVAAAYKRAVDGFDGPDGTKKYSDVLLVRMLKAADPEQFGDRVRVDAKVTPLPVDVNKLSPESLKLLDRMIEIEAGRAVASAAVPQLQAPQEETQDDDEGEGEEDHDYGDE